MNQKTRKQRRNTIRRRNNKRRQRKTRTRRVGGMLPPPPSKNPPKGYLRLPGNSPPPFVYPLNHGNASTLSPMSVPPPRENSLNLNSVFAPPSTTSTNKKNNMIYPLSEEKKRRHQQEKLKEIERIENRLNEIKYNVMRMGFNRFNGSAKEDTTDPMQYFNPTISENHFEGLGYTHKPVNYSNPKLQ